MCLYYLIKHVYIYIYIYIYVYVRKGTEPDVLVYLRKALYLKYLNFIDSGWRRVSG